MSYYSYERNNEPTEEKQRKRKKFKGYVALAIIFLFAVVMFSKTTVHVPTGYVAVQYDMNGGLKDKVLTQGWHFFVSPTIHTTNYAVGMQQSYLTSGKNGDSPDNESYSASTSEGKAVTIDLTFTYQYDAASVVQVYTQFMGQSGKEVRDNFIKPNIISWSKEVIAKYPVTDILGAERANINIALTEYLSNKFAPYGITITNVSLINVDVDEETQQAINDKINAQQAAERQAIINQQNIDEATATAKAQKIEAQGKADAMIIEAEAEAEANEIINASLTDKLIEKMYYATWDGALPDVITGDSGATVVIPEDIG